MDNVQKHNICTKQISLCIMLLCTSKNERPKAGFKGKRPGLSLRDLHKTKTDSTDFVGEFASLKS
jgi:hypothetical protein